MGRSDGFVLTVGAALYFMVLRNLKQVSDWCARRLVGWLINRSHRWSWFWTDTIPHVEPASGAFDDERYIFEPKWDGWRILVHKQGDRIEAFTRNGRRVTDKFPELREAAEAITVHSAILDCEGVCIRDGRSVFDDFQYRGRLTDPRRIAKAMTTTPVTFVAFDLLHTHLDSPLNR